MSSEPDERPGLPACAKRKRYNPKGAEPLVIESMPCLSGGRLKEPIRLPTKVVDAELMVRFASKEPWPFQLVAGRVDAGASLNAAQGRVRETIRKLMEEAERSSRAGASRDDAIILEAATAGRSKLGLDDSSGDEERAASPKQANEPKAKIVRITLRGTELGACREKQQCWFSCTPAAMEAVCEEMREELLPKAVARAKARAQARLGAAASDSGPIGGSVRWEPQRGRFCISYRTAEGRRVQCRKGLTVAEQSAAGEPLSEEGHKAEFRRKLRLAQQRWNELDHSGGAKFVLT